jgi:hypothetical protein
VKIQNLKSNCGIVRHKKIFYNNIYFDSNIDIDSDADQRNQHQRSYNSSIKKGGSIGKSINLSLERQYVDQRAVLPRF